MAETSLAKFERIVGWYVDNASEAVSNLVAQQDFGQLATIEHLIDATLPDDIGTLYMRYGGDSRDHAGCFIGHGFMGLDQILESTEFARSLIKPEKPVVLNAKASDAVILHIVEEMIQQLDKLARLGVVSANWYRCEFECSPRSFGGPYVYETPDVSDQERKIVGSDHIDYDKFYALAAELADLEGESYNWDKLNFVVFRDRQYQLERQFYNLGDPENFTSYPEGAIQRTYFHLRWVPIIQDHGGNYIGVDLEPGPTGRRGQVIVFGRDEYDMFVLADDWEGFLDLILGLIESQPEVLLSDCHLHDVLKPIIMASK
jgi:cell wall assembly regulator SMI1